jgi:hypothetical protein
MIQHQFGQSFKSGADTTRSITETVNVDSEEKVKRDIPSGATTQFNITVDVSEMKTLCCGITKGSCTIKTNSSGSPVQTLTIKSTNPIMWSKNDNPTNPLTTDLTALYVTNDGTEDAEFFFTAGVDSTPSAEG